MNDYERGFLVDDEVLAGISADPQAPHRYLAYVVRHTTGEMLACETFATQEEAAKALEGLERKWKFEGTHSCESEGCQGGNCGTCTTHACGVE